ncbi:MAG: hypothetical protein IPK03_15500 [Bacteroidetes bacterium]|nr:hypothetical protein [Bacteroidota bacterium]
MFKGIYTLVIKKSCIFRNILPWVFVAMLVNPLASYSLNERVEALNKLILEEKSDTLRARLTGELAWELKFVETERAIELANREIQIGKAYQHQLILAEGYRVKGLALVIQEKIIPGMACYDSSVLYAQKAKNTSYEISCYNLIGGMYNDHGDFDKSIEFYRKGLTLAQKTNDPKLIAILSNNLAETYQSSNRSTELVQRYLMLALDNSKQSKNWLAAGMNAANLALEFAKLGQMRKAEIVLKESIDLMNLNSAKSYQYGTTCHVLSSVFYELGDMNACIHYAQISIQIMDSLKQPDNALRPMTNLAHAFVRLKDISNAQLYATRLLSDAKKRNAKLYIRDGYKTLAEIAELKGDTKLALEHYKRYKTYNDSIFEINRERNITNMEAMAALSKNEQEIKFKTMQQSLENVNLKNQNSGLQKQRMLILILCLVFAALIVMLYKSNRAVSRVNIDLEKAKARVERQVVEKGIMVKEIHHRVKNNLTMLKGLLYLQAKSSNHSETKITLEECQLRIENMALVHQKLYEESDLAQLNLKDFLETMFRQLEILYLGANRNVEFKLSGDSVLLNVSTAIPLGLMMNELITNSFKYAFQQVDTGIISIGGS